MYCECGCGKITSVAKVTDKTKGWIKGQHVRFLRWHKRIKHNVQTGDTFGDWTVIKEDGVNCNNSPMWLCRCKCGRQSRIKKYDLFYGVSKACRSCGQLKGQHAGKNSPNYKHGNYVGYSTTSARNSRKAFRILTALNTLEQYAPELLACIDIKAQKESLYQKIQVNMLGLNQLFGAQ